VKSGNWMKRKRYDLADWLILAMHWGLGALVGAGIMFKTASRSAVLSTWLMWGGACMMGGITGLVQNRYWNRDTYRVIPPERSIAWRAGG
jgi:hypothetical protein